RRHGRGRLRPGGRRRGPPGRPRRGRAQLQRRRRRTDRRGRGAAVITTYSWMVPLLVVLPLVGAGLALAAAGRTWVQRAVSMSVLGSMLVLAGVLLWAADQQGAQVVYVGGWLP